MKTGSFRTHKGPGAVSIARSARGFRGPSYRALAPGSWWKSVVRKRYEQLFAMQLAELDPVQVIADLRKLVHPHEPVLMCWETPPFTETNWCHRRLVADWLATECGIRLDELTPGMDLYVISARAEIKLVKWSGR